jgi:hypothetical protein
MSLVSKNKFQQYHVKCDELVGDDLALNNPHVNHIVGWLHRKVGNKYDFTVGNEYRTYKLFHFQLAMFLRVTSDITVDEFITRLHNLNMDDLAHFMFTIAQHNAYLTQFNYEVGKLEFLIDHGKLFPWTRRYTMDSFL